MAKKEKKPEKSQPASTKTDSEGGGGLRTILLVFLAIDAGFLVFVALYFGIAHLAGYSGTDVLSRSGQELSSPAQQAISTSAPSTSPIPQDQAQVADPSQTAQEPQLPVQTVGDTGEGSSGGGSDNSERYPKDSSKGNYVGSIDSDKYHYPSCRWAEEILSENEIWFASVEDAKAAGYSPCGTCNP